MHYSFGFSFFFFPPLVMGLLNGTSFSKNSFRSTIHRRKLVVSLFADKELASKKIVGEGLGGWG